MAISTIKENTKKYGKGQRTTFHQLITVGRTTGSGNYLDFNLPINVQNDVSNIAINVFAEDNFTAVISNGTSLTSVDFDLTHAHVISQQHENVCIEVPILSAQPIRMPATLILFEVSFVFS